MKHDACDDVCPDQREAFARFAETGAAADAAKIHFEDCPTCAAAVEKVLLRRAAGPEAAAVAAAPKKTGGFLKRHWPEVAFSAFLLAAIGGGSWWLLSPESQREVMTDVVDDYGFFRDPRTGLCFSHTGSGADVSLVDCEATHGWFDKELARLGRKAWYFQDLTTGVCYAQIEHHGHPSSFAVPCRNVEHLFDAADSRFRYQKWK